MLLKLYRPVRWPVYKVDAEGANNRSYKPLSTRGTRDREYIVAIRKATKFFKPSRQYYFLLTLLTFFKMTAPAKGYIFSDQMAMFGKREILGFGDDAFYVKEIPKQQSKEIIIKNHYSHKVCNDATTHIHLGCWIKGELLGVMQFGYAMNPQSMGNTVDGTKLDQYKELNRMWFDDRAGRNTESMAISYAIRYIRGVYPRVKWIQSFADERCGGLGVVYQAANFAYYGEHKNIFWIIDDEIYHNSIVTNNSRGKKAELEAKNWRERAIKMELRQFRYIYWIDQRWKKRCLLKQMCYPKPGVNIIKTKVA